MSRIFIMVIIFLFSLQHPVLSADAPLLAQSPALSRTHVVFVFDK